MENTTAVSPPPAAVGVWTVPARKFALWAGFVLLCFALPLYQLFVLSFFSKRSDFYSYLPLIPFVSGYLFWINRERLPDRPKSSPVAAAVVALGGLLVVAGYFIARTRGVAFEISFYLALMTISALLFLLAGMLFFLGGGFLQANVFAVCMLAFAVPPPQFLLNPVESFLQTSSAAAATLMFWLAGTPHLTHGTILRLPDITIEVAPECSGIHSTVVLFITSFLAGRLFLRTLWRRATLVLVALPLAILRNGFRVFTIGELCVHISPDMIDSPIHHKGGPIFFALSLIPFFLLLVFLRKQESSRVSPELNRIPSL